MPEIACGYESASSWRHASQPVLSDGHGDFNSACRVVDGRGPAKRTGSQPVATAAGNESVHSCWPAPGTDRIDGGHRACMHQRTRADATPSPSITAKGGAAGGSTALFFRRIERKSRALPSRGGKAARRLRFRRGGTVMACNACCKWLGPVRGARGIPAKLWCTASGSSRFDCRYARVFGGVCGHVHGLGVAHRRVMRPPGATDPSIDALRFDSAGGRPFSAPRLGGLKGAIIAQFPFIPIAKRQSIVRIIGSAFRLDR